MPVCLRVCLNFLSVHFTERKRERDCYRLKTRIPEKREPVRSDSIYFNFAYDFIFFVCSRGSTSYFAYSIEMLNCVNFLPVSVRFPTNRTKIEFLPKINRRIDTKSG